MRQRHLNKLLIALLFCLCFYGFTNRPDVKFIPLTGKLVNHGSSSLIGDNDLWRMENYRYYDTGLGTRLGMTDYTSDSAPEGSELVWIAPFNQENDFYLFAAVCDASKGVTVYQIEDQAFGTTELFKTSGTTPISGGMCRDSFVYVDSAGVSVWGGVSTFPTAILVESPTNTFTNRSLWIYDGIQHTVPSGSTWYIGYSRPFDAVQADKDSSTWDTSFLSSVTPEYKGGLFRYWATCLVTAGASTFESPKIKTTPRPLDSHWDGKDWQFAQAALFSKSGSSEYQDYSLYVADSSPEYYMDVSEWNSGGTIYFVFPRLPMMVRLEFPENNKNSKTSTLSGYYWNGSSYGSIPGFKDGTSHGGAAFAQDGNLTFNYITNWEKRTVGENNFEGYAMYLKTSATIDNYVRIFKVTAIPYYKSPNDYHLKSSLVTYNRVFLFNGDDLGRFMVSAENQPDVFIGSDAVTWEDDYRIGRNEKVVAAVPISFGIMWMKESENIFMQGYNPDTYELQSLPNTAPCVSSQSAVVFNRTEGSFVVYQGVDGIYALDASGNNLPLSEDIKAYWENGNSLEIPKAWLERSIGWQDPINDTYNLLVASGSGSTQFNTQLVFDMKRKKWSSFTRDNNVEISYGTYLKDNNNQRIQFAGGYLGQVWQLDKGTNDDGYAIISDHTSKAFAFDACRAEIRNVAFGYELPDDTQITGCTLYITPSIASGHTEYQTGVTLTNSGFTMRTPAGDDVGRVGNYHKIRLRVPGRVFFNRELIEVREAPCPGE